MILFFFLLLMLAMAWGVADHYQSLVANAPPAEPAPVRVEAQVPQPPPVVPPASTTPGPDSDQADDAKPADAPPTTSDKAGMAAADDPTGKP